MKTKYALKLQLKCDLNSKL